MSAVQPKLLAIWSDVLGKPKIQVTDDFYEVGGTSLTLIRMLGRVKVDLGVDVFYGDLLGTVTVESLALLVEKANDGVSKDDALDEQQSGSQALE